MLVLGNRRGVFQIWGCPPNLGIITANPKDPRLGFVNPAHYAVPSAGINWGSLFDDKEENRWRLMMGILSWIVVGLIAGWLAGMVMKGGGYGLVGDIIIGVVGGLLGGWIATTFLHIGAGVNGINVESILVAFAGAVVLLIGMRLLGGGGRRSRLFR